MDPFQDEKRIAILRKRSIRIANYLKDKKGTISTIKAFKALGLIVSIGLEMNRLKFSKPRPKFPVGGVMIKKD